MISRGIKKRQIIEIDREKNTRKKIKIKPKTK